MEKTIGDIAYVLVKPEVPLAAMCTGCAAEDNTELCLALGVSCCFGSSQDKVWLEKKDV